MRLRLSATVMAAPSRVAADGWGLPSRVRGDTSVTSQHNASPSGVAPYTTRSRRRRSAGSTSRADVRANHCCGTTWPSGPTASRAMRTHACSRGFARRASSPVRGHAAWWSPSASTAAPQPCPCAPHLCGATGKGSRSRRRKAISMRSGGRAEPASLGMAPSHAAACGPDCDRSMAWAGGGKVGNSSVSRKWVEQAREP